MGRSDLDYEVFDRLKFVNITKSPLTCGFDKRGNTPKHLHGAVALPIPVWALILDFSNFLAYFQIAFWLLVSLLGGNDSRIVISGD